MRDSLFTTEDGGIRPLRQASPRTWKLAGYAIMAASAVGTMALYCHLALLAIASI